jgi:DNA-binding transcriptional LysR family regulator
MDLRNVDLNLLVTLDALLSEQSVSHAARRLRRSQPAVSAALARLRDLLNDRLLVRQGSAMAPTDYAKSVAMPLRSLLREIEQTFAPKVFDPATGSRIFRIATTDYATFTLFPRLMSRIRKVAPSVGIELWQIEENVHDRLAARDLDLAVADDWSLRHLPARETLYSERFVCVVRRDHPRIRGVLSVERFVAEKHALVSARGRVAGNVDGALERFGKRRDVVLTMPHFLAVPAIIEETDLVVTLAERIARKLSAGAALRILKPPVDLEGFDVSMAWSRITEHDAALDWLKQEIRRASPPPRERPISVRADLRAADRRES